MGVVAKQIEVAVQNAKQTEKLETLYGALVRSNRDLEIMNAITQAVHESFDLLDVYKIALDKVLEINHIDAVMVYLVDEERCEAVLQAHRNLTNDYVQRAGRIAYPKGLTWRAINTGKIINIEDAEKDPDTGPAGRELGHHGCLGVPIIQDGRSIGVIWFTCYEEHKFDQKEVKLLSTVGHQIASAITKAKLYTGLARKNRYENIISTVTRAVHQSIELQDVLENAVDAMSENIKGTDNVSIYMVEGEQAILKAYRGYPDWFIEQAGRIPYPKGFTWRAIMAGKPVYCGDTDQDKAMGPAGRKLGTKCYVSMPIRSKGVTVGVINVNSLAKNAFDDEELKLLEIVARQIEIAINNASQAQAIRESEKRFRNMADSAPIMIWMSDVEKLCTYVNKGWEQFTGRTIEQDLGDGWVQSVHADDLSLCRDTYISAFDARKEYEMVYRLRRYDGQYRWILEKGVPRFLSNGSFVGYIGSCVDITDRKEAEERLSISARQLKHLSHRLMNVQEIERRHLASELHDEIGQVLTAVKIDLQSIHGLNKDRSHATRLKESISVVDRALKQVRDLSLNLRPSMLDDLGLVATLRWYVSQQAKLGRFTATFAANPSTLRFTPTLEVICFRVVQEALTNILRHARAKKVSVVLNLVDSGVELVIRDDGVGFDLLAAQERMTRGLSFGLLGMQERIELAGGKIEIRSEPKKGTEVRTVFPLSSGF